MLNKKKHYSCGTTNILRLPRNLFVQLNNDIKPTFDIIKI